MHVGGKCREIDEKARSAVVTVGNSEKSVFVVYTHTHVRHSRLGSVDLSQASMYALHQLQSTERTGLGVRVSINAS